jgi:class 3 adenylate cyclase
MSETDQVAYAQADETHVAYRTIEGDGALDIVMVAGMFFPMEALAADRVAARFMAGLAEIGRLTVFDKRGIGLSDPVTDWDRPTSDQWAEDLVAVIEAAGLENAVVVSWDPFGIGRITAARRPDLVDRLVLINPVEGAQALRALIEQEGDDNAATHTQPIEKLAFPSRIDDAAFQSWLAQAGRLGASPSTAGRLWESLLSDDGRGLSTPVTASTLVIHNRDCMAQAPVVAQVAASIPGAQLVEIAGEDILPIAGDVDAVVAEIAEFVTGAAHVPAPRRRIAAVLFTDLVGSTSRAVDEGDERWRDLLDTHDEITRGCVDRQGGRVIKATGDGVLALMPSASSALRAARTVQERLRADGLQIRAGVHVGDVDERGDDVSGLVVNVAARIMDEAGPDQVLVSESARRAMIGSAFAFTGRRTLELKGVPEEWTVWSAQSGGQDGSS